MSGSTRTTFDSSRRAVGRPSSFTTVGWKTGSSALQMFKLPSGSIPIGQSSLIIVPRPATTLPIGSRCSCVKDFSFSQHRHTRSASPTFTLPVFHLHDFNSSGNHPRIRHVTNSEIVVRAPATTDRRGQRRGGRQRPQGLSVHREGRRAGAEVEEDVTPSPPPQRTGFRTEAACRRRSNTARPRRRAATNRRKKLQPDPCSPRTGRGGG